MLLRVSAILCVTASLLYAVSDDPAGAASQVSAATKKDFLSRLWISGQANFVTQWHPNFHSRYSGPNSFSSKEEVKTSRVLTLYTGFRLSNTSDVFLNIEETSGANLGGVVGLAGFTDADTTGVPNARPYVARAFFHHIFNLGGGPVQTQRGPLQLQSEVPERRLEVFFGKVSLLDFFDVNAVGSDTHFQFLNWAVDNNAAYGYPADVRGYTYAAVFDFEQRTWGARFAEALVPVLNGNGTQFNTDLGRSRTETVELEWRHSLLAERLTIVRPLLFLSHGPVGNYRQAIDAYLNGTDKSPDVTLHRSFGMRYGTGVNIEQEVTKAVRCFGRFGWSEGALESTAFTEVNQVFSGGFDLRGDRWKRVDDRVGGAFVVEALSGDHRRYLELGGTGLLLGDGRLNYGREQIVEAYYSTKLWHGLYAGVDFQHIYNPGYNRDRGPVFVASFRLHLEGILFDASGK